MIFSNFSVTEILQNFVILFLTISVHEYSHGFVAHKLGDPTAKSMGRLTLNPLAHLDPLGALMMIFCRFGWAKAVPVNPYYFKNPKRGMVLVSLAGPFSNFLMAIVFATIFPVFIVIAGKFMLLDNPLIKFVVGLLNTGIIMNVCFGVFNLIPFPPLDGSKVLFSVLPNRIYNTILTYERYGTILLLLLSFSGILGKILNFVAEPILDALYFWVDTILKLLSILVF